jgi:CRISPR-associated protein Csm1
MMLICGDFWGIQKFIFERLSSKNASKVLRAKSAFIQLFTEYLAKYICNKLEINETSILSITAGKFEILLTEKEININDIQQKIDNYFIDNFYGLSGVSISKIKCKKEDFLDKTRYKALRDKIAEKVEIQKFQKFNLASQDPLLSYNKNIDDQNLCKICNIRKGQNNCIVCNSFIKLGKLLVKEQDTKISSDELNIIIDDFKVDFILDKKIKFYVLKDGHDTPAPFETLANNSCKELDTGIKSLAILKADVDNMGIFLKNSDITQSFENFDTFSKTLNNFFALYIPKLIKEKYKNTYTVFAGGDDLFLVGSWDTILRLSRVIQKDFKKFIKEKLSISFGIAIAKPSYPISYLANYTEELLEDAKEIDKEKDAITLFGETTKWQSYIKTSEKLEKEFNKLNKNNIKTAFLYRLLELVELSKKVKYENDILSTMWKSKLNYSFNRNMDKRSIDLLKVLNQEIEQHPKETKMFLSEFIYKRRQI